MPMREPGLPHCRAVGTFNFMKTLRILTALAALALSGAPAAHAGIAADPTLRAPDSPAVTAVRALFNRCFPVMSGRPALALGLRPAEPQFAERLLDNRPGSAWQARDRSLFMVAYDDSPVCKVVALDVDAFVLGDLVLGVFREDETPFRQQRFSVGKTGGFAAVYTADVSGTEIVVRIHTALNGQGRTIATLSIERSGQIAH